MQPGLDLKTVQKMMGHAKLESTMRYLRAAEAEDVQSAVNSMAWR
jgi:site-specific recombinase XerD